MVWSTQGRRGSVLGNTFVAHGFLLGLTHSCPSWIGEQPPPTQGAASPPSGSPDSRRNVRCTPPYPR